MKYPELFVAIADAIDAGPETPEPVAPVLIEVPVKLPRPKMPDLYQYIELPDGKWVHIFRNCAVLYEYRTEAYTESWGESSDGMRPAGWSNEYGPRPKKISDISYQYQSEIETWAKHWTEYEAAAEAYESSRNQCYEIEDSNRALMAQYHQVREQWANVSLRNWCAANQVAIDEDGDWFVMAPGPYDEYPTTLFKSDVAKFFQ